jgi:hypothetical protein
MSKKLCMNLAPFALIVAFAMPAVAQAATPHYYVNGVKSEEGTKVPFISWGKTSSTSSLGGATSECENAVGGFIENPVGGGSGKEETNSLYTYNCTNAECEAAGGKLGVIFENENKPGPAVQLAWPGELTEAVAGKIRFTGSNLREYVHCQVAYAEPSDTEVTEGPLKGTTAHSRTEFNVWAGVCTTEAPGAAEPLWVNGTSIGKPSKLEFTGGPPLECGTGGKGFTAMSVKIMGYRESEVLTTKKI